MSSSVDFKFDSFDRVRSHTPTHVNWRINHEILGAVTYLSRQSPDVVNNHIKNLDYEWDIDRALMLNFALIGGTVFSLGLTQNRKWFYLLGAQTAFLAWHALSGWCPPVSLLRRMGFRTKTEIETEKRMLLRLLEQKERPLARVA
jgi:hypothetical protein